MSSKMLVVVLLVVLPLSSVGQRQILGDITEQRISQVYDEDVREENLYRRPPTYLIIASKIVRPSTIYQVRILIVFRKAANQFVEENFALLLWQATGFP